MCGVREMLVLNCSQTCSVLGSLLAMYLFKLIFIGQSDVVSASLRRYNVACCFKVDGASSHVRLIFDGMFLGTIV